LELAAQWLGRAGSIKRDQATIAFLVAMGWPENPALPWMMQSVSAIILVF
jgi:hypothetical protein